MDPRDRLRPFPDGATCSACGATVPARRIRTLARRDDLAFVELDCRGCGSILLGLLIPSAAPGDDPILDVASESAVSRRSFGAPAVRPISAADVEAIRDDLAAWHGDLVGWLDALDASDRRRSVVDR